VPNGWAEVIAVVRLPALAGRLKKQRRHRMLSPGRAAELNEAAQ